MTTAVAPTRHTRPARTRRATPAGHRKPRVRGQKKGVRPAAVAAARGVPKTQTLEERIAELRAQTRARNTLLRMEVSFGNQVKAVRRQLEKYPGSLPADFSAKDFVDLERILRTRRLATEKICVGLVEKLPGHDWWTSHRGLGSMGLAQVIGITGDLKNFANPAKLWKFMSLHVVDGRAARRAKGSVGVTQGFSPFRRTVMHQIGEAVMKLNRGSFKEMYDARKSIELTKLPEDARGRKGWAHKRALRYMEKRILRDLWRRWRASAA